MRKTAYIHLAAWQKILRWLVTYLDSFTSRKMLRVTEMDGNYGINDAWKMQCVGKKTDISRKQIS